MVVMVCSRSVSMEAWWRENSAGRTRHTGQGTQQNNIPQAMNRERLQWWRGAIAYGAALPLSPGVNAV